MEICQVSSGKYEITPLQCKNVRFYFFWVTALLHSGRPARNFFSLRAALNDISLPWIVFFTCQDGLFLLISKVFKNEAILISGHKTLFFAGYHKHFRFGRLCQAVRYCCRLSIELTCHINQKSILLRLLFIPVANTKNTIKWSSCCRIQISCSKFRHGKLINIGSVLFRFWFSIEDTVVLIFFKF